MPTLKIGKATPLHASIIRKLTARITLSRQEMSKHHKRWHDAEERMIAYVPESIADSKRRTRRDNGEPQYTTIQIPYTYALVMTAHTYWTSVFFGRSPIHQFVGRHGAGEMEVQALESLIQYQVDAGEMMAPYYLWLYDAAKYGVGIIGTYWDSQQINYGSLILGPDGQLMQNSQVVAGYTGNCAYNVSPFDFFVDPRVTMGQFQRGEFCGRLLKLAWHELLAKKKSGDYMNVEALTTNPRTSGGDSDNSDSAAVITPTDNWELDDGTNKHPSRARLFEVYVRCIPSEWGVGPSDAPEIWVFTLASDFSVLLGATPLSTVTGLFPFDAIEPELEAYGVFNRGIPEMAAPLQFTMDWLLNSHMFNVRAALNNQFIIDPSRIVMKDIEKGGPGFVFRMRPEAYGQDVRQMFTQVPVNDVTRPHMQDIDAMFSMGERTFGINEQMFGMLSSGGSDRKTATEVRSATGFGVNRQKTQTEWISASAFVRHAKKLIANSQQYYSGEQKFRIVGDALADAGAAFMQVTPDLIAGQFDYQPVDGTLPVDRQAQVAMWKDLLSSLSTSEMGMAVLQQYDIGKLIGWVFSLGGLKNVNQFKVQVLPPGQGPSPGMVPQLPSPGGEAQAPGQNPQGGVADPGAQLGEALGATYQ